MPITSAFENIAFRIARTVCNPLLPRLRTISITVMPMP